MPDSPSLPAPYDFVRLAEVDSVRAELARRARAGADEGLLLWVDTQTDARARLGRRWQCSPGDLHCGVLLRPDFDRIKAAQLSLVGTLAVGQALGELAAAMTGLHYRWPNDVLLNGGKTASLWLDAPSAGDPLEWLGLSFSINVLEHPEEDDLHATSLRAQEAEQLDRAEILATVSRHLLSGLNRWAEAGLGPSLRTWRARLYDIGDEMQIALPGSVVSGRPLGIDDHGSLQLETQSGERRVSLLEFHGLHEERTGD